MNPAPPVTRIFIFLLTRRWSYQRGRSDALASRYVVLNGGEIPDPSREGPEPAGPPVLSPVALDAQDLEAGVAEQILYAPAREEAKVRVVQDAPGLVAPLGEQQLLDNLVVPDIGDARDHGAAFLEARAQAKQRCPGVAQVLQDIRDHERVETTGPMVERHRLDVSYVDLVEPRPGNRGRERVQLDTHDPCGFARALEVLTEHAGAAADLEHRTGGRGDLLEQTVARQRVVGEIAHRVRQARQPEFVDAIQPAFVEELAIAFFRSPPFFLGELFHRDVLDVLDLALRTVHDLQTALPHLEAQIDVLVPLKIVLVESPDRVEEVASHE